ncbi:RIP metalloprotease RseP [Enterococcus olivae]
MQTVLVFLIVFSVVVVIHEFGHFYFAKRAGILVREFAIGMGPKIYNHQGKDGTTYTIRALPMGGYVRMAGYEEEDEIQAGMQIGLLVDESGKVVKINTSKKVQLANAIPLEVSKYDLVDELTISGFINGDESEVVTYPVDHDAFIIEEDGTEVRIAPRDVQFQSAKLWQRMLTNFAGPMNNFILTILLFMVIVFLRGGVVDNNSTVIGEVMEDGVAVSAGLETGDKILTINQVEVDNWPEIRQTIQENPDTELQVEISRDDQQQTIAVTPSVVEIEGEEVGQLGIMPPMKNGFFDVIKGGFTESINLLMGTLNALRSLVTDFSLNQLGGPVAIFQMSSEAARQGPMTVLLLTAMISMSIGIFNLIPIPGLDGGKLLLNIVEGIRGKPLSQEKEGIITLVGFGLLMLLMILVTWNDIQRFFF